MDSENANVSEGKIETGAVAESADRRSKQPLKDIREKSREVTTQLYEQIKAQTKSILSDQKDRVAGELETLAKVLHDTGEKLRENRWDSTSEITESGVRNLEGLSEYLRNHDPEDVVNDLQELARRQPAIFLSTALLSGFFLGQILSTYGRPADESQVFHPKKEHSIEYKPGEDEEGYYERH